MASTHPIHLPEPIYLPPDIHVPRDVTDDDFDGDSFMGDIKVDADPDDEIPDHQFEKAAMERIWPLNQMPYVEPVSVLLPIPKTAAETRELFEQAMTCLRKRVSELEEEEMFESAMRNFTHRSTMTTNTIDPSANILMVIDGSGSENGVFGSVFADVMAEPVAAGLGGQPRSVDAAALLRADVDKVWKKGKGRKSKG